MHLQNFDIETLVERLRDALDQRRQQIDAEAHIAGLHHDGALGDALDHGVVGGRQAGGTDDMDEAALGGDRDIGDGSPRHGEIEDAVGIGRQRPQIGGKLDAIFGEAGEHAGILAEQLGARRFQRAGQYRARRLRDDARQRTAHPAAGPRNDQAHVRHSSSSSRGIAGAVSSGNQSRL